MWSRRGEVTLPVRESIDDQPGSVFIPFHFREAAANVLTTDVLDPDGKIPEFKFCAVLPGRVVLSTTTRIFAAQMSRAAAVCTTADEGWQDELERFAGNLLIVGRVEGERAVGVPPELPAEWLARPDVDWVVVEADGSRMLPVKAPAEHEPVVPEQTDLLVCVVGIDALTEPIERVAHRPERVAEITGLDLSQHLTPGALGALLTSPRGGLKGAPDGARDRGVDQQGGVEHTARRGAPDRGRCAAGAARRAGGDWRPARGSPRGLGGPLALSRPASAVEARQELQKRLVEALALIEVGGVPCGGEDHDVASSKPVGHSGKTALSSYAPGAQILRALPAQYGSRSCRTRSFPIGLRGSSASKSTERGTL